MVRMTKDAGPSPPNLVEFVHLPYSHPFFSLHPSTCPSTHPSFLPSIHPLNYLHIHHPSTHHSSFLLSIDSSTFPSTHPPILLSVYSLIHPLVHPSTLAFPPTNLYSFIHTTFAPTHQSVYSPSHHSSHLSIHPSIHWTTHSSPLSLRNFHIIVD